ncbi:heat shock factor protein 5 [Hyperolius riggenbachi]|uniref:heat shock factor protein 5 n=1 Tax=Hyperolius riggenbachi TaxID=752182 RepID=UPI0035A2742F
MDAEDYRLSTLINRNNFPAKLWRLASDPLYKSIRWDLRGEGIIVDQQLFQSELLAQAKVSNEPHYLFKTTNFASFVRQLNLYGFKKIILTPDELDQSGGNLAGGESSLHHFYNFDFCRDCPKRLVNLKRLTSINKAKLSAGLKVTSRPPNRLHQFFINSLGENSMGGYEDPVTMENNHHTSRHENVSPYPCVHPGHKRHVPFPLNEFEHSPVYPDTKPNSLDLSQGHSVSPLYPGQNIHLSVVQQPPTEVIYTLQASATSVHVQQKHAVLAGSVHKYGGYYSPTVHSYVSPTMHCPYVCYPAATRQYYSSPYMEHLTRFASPTGLSFEPYIYYQRPAVQTPLPMEPFQPYSPYGTNGCKTDNAIVNASDTIVPAGQIEPLASGTSAAMKLPSDVTGMMEPLTNTLTGKREVEDLLI